MKVTGVVKGAGATRVTLYQRNGTKWVPWTSAKLVSGHYTLNYKPYPRAAHHPRIHASYHKAPSGVSPNKTMITVYKWHFLSDFAEHEPRGC